MKIILLLYQIIVLMLLGKVLCIETKNFNPFYEYVMA